MRIILLYLFILLVSCESRKAAIVKQQEVIKQKMEQVKAAYYKATDSLDRLKKADTGLQKAAAYALQLFAIDREKSIALTRLQRQYDALEAELK